MPNKLKDKVRHKFKKKSYNKRNWPAYDQALKNRGSITIWFSKDAVEQWNQKPAGKQKKGRPKTYSDLAIQTCQILRALFKQPLRQTEGLISSIVEMLTLDLKTPDHSTLSRRLGTISIPKRLQNSREPKVIAVDSTGLKVMGEKEWQAFKHGTKEVKVWLKLHIAIDEESGEILSHTLTEHTISDTAQVETLIEQIEQPITEILGDGGYDHKATYNAIDQHAIGHKPKRETIITVPPNIGFQPIRNSDHKERKRNQRIIDEYGRETWQEISRYGRRSKVEGTFSRWKRIVGNTIKSKNTNNQLGEIQIGVFILNETIKRNPAKAQKAA